MPTDSLLLRDKSFSNITFTDDDIVKIMKGLNPNRAHGLDMISIRMMKLNLQTLRFYFTRLLTLVDAEL